eukprot:5696417-Amphidinium_carterae.2
MKTCPGNLGCGEHAASFRILPDMDADMVEEMYGPRGTRSELPSVEVEGCDFVFCCFLCASTREVDSERQLQGRWVVLSSPRLNQTRKMDPLGRIEKLSLRTLCVR